MKKYRLVLVLSLLTAVLLGYSLAMTFSVGHQPPTGVWAKGRAAPALPFDYTAAESVQEVFRRVAAEVLPSVVEIEVTSVTDEESPGERGLPWQEFFIDPEESEEGPRSFESQGLGSGVIVQRQGSLHYVLTNAHVVGDAQEIVVRLHDGETRPGTLLGKDGRKDLAMITFEDEVWKYPPVELGDSNDLYVGDWVLAVGSPYGYEQSVSSGIVSALGRRKGPGGNINDFIQTDAAINQGNSGGALVDIRGRLVGINTFITTSTGGSIGLGFAIPVNNITTTISQFLKTGEVRYGWLGVSIGDPGQEEMNSLGYTLGEGVMVYQVFQNSPAAKAGFRPGDLILKLNNRKVENADRLTYGIGDLAPGEKAEFFLSRFGEQLSLTAVTEARESEEAVNSLHTAAWPGFVAAPLVEDLREAMELEETAAGVVVADVYPQTAAQLAGLRVGDLITHVEEKSVGSLKDLYQFLESSSPINWTVLREGEVVELAP